MLNILFVCTGNTCRSPMAEAIFTHEAKKRSLENVLSCKSAGIFADNSPITLNAQNALSRLGITDFSHISQSLSDVLINEADIILCMTRRHREYIALENVFTLHEFIGCCGDVQDPYGGDDTVYFETAKELEMLINKCIDKIQNELL